LLRMSAAPPALRAAALLLTLGLPAPASAAEDPLSEAIKQGDHATVLRLVQPLADQGDPQYECILGSIYANGSGVPEDDAQALKWYHLAAIQGTSCGQFSLGQLYRHGGQGVPRDTAQAIYWFKLDATRPDGSGNSVAQTILGNIYAAGDGVPKDEVQAAFWYRRAVDANDYQAQTALAALYAAGRGVPHDDVLAYQWAHLAAAQGWPDAAALRDTILAPRMSPADISTAQRLSREWHAPHDPFEPIR
jgi:TPR repeat protein